MPNKTSYSNNFSVLPLDMMKLTGSFLIKESMARLSQTSKGFYQFFKKDMEKEAIKKLSMYVLYGEEIKALSMITCLPERLCGRAKAIDYSGRSFECMPFQAALLAHDVTLWKKMESHFDNIPNGQAEKVKQFKEIFPNGLPDQKSYDFSALMQIISFSSDTDVLMLLNNPLDTTSALGQTMKTFRENFTTLSMNELFFNPKHLIKAFDTYVQQYDSWSMNQSRLFWSQVIGYVQRFLPACYAQALCQGLYYVVEKNDPLTRTLKFKYNSISYFPLNDSSALGFGFGVYSHMQGGETGMCVGGKEKWRAQRCKDNFEELCQANTSELFKLERRLYGDRQSVKGSDELTSRSRCVIS
ncbi:Uncharacterised protein [Legionella busanensis]|uniref:Uncharacterized protein n=1 Tax=Legionella busanensis TaxID=190655 RepID=A0A378K9Q5_9GAMM|nr:hypothetical protein [Legionella busanensis]STX81436.1 Uncharacterised protein [Legionella busanensis]